MAELASVTDADFEQKVTSSAIPVLVDFYGTWCAPCVQLKPVVAAIAAEYEGRISVYEAEITQAPQAAGANDVLSVPTLALFVGGQVREALTGSPERDEIIEMITRHLEA